VDREPGPLAVARSVASLVFATGLLAAACSSPTRVVRDDTPFKPGWVRHEIDAHVAVSAPPALRFIARPTSEHAGAMLKSDDLDVYLLTGASFVYPMTPSPGDTVRPRQTLTIAGQPVQVEAWQREPARFAGKPFELAVLFEAKRIRVSAHAACRTAAACEVGRDVLASIAVTP
jgi:hypothetical protein